MADLLRIFKVSYLGPTKSRQARVSIVDKHFETYKLFKYDGREGDTLQQAKKFLISKDINIDYCANFGNAGALLLTTNLNTRL